MGLQDAPTFEEELQQYMAGGSNAAVSFEDEVREYMGGDDSAPPRQKLSQWEKDQKELDRRAIQGESDSPSRTFVQRLAHSLPLPLPSRSEPLEEIQRRRALERESPAERHLHEEMRRFEEDEDTTAIRQDANRKWARKTLDAGRRWRISQLRDTLTANDPEAPSQLGRDYSISRHLPDHHQSVLKQAQEDPSFAQRSPLHAAMVEAAFQNNESMSGSMKAPLDPKSLATALKINEQMRNLRGEATDFRQLSDDDQERYRQLRKKLGSMPSDGRTHEYKNPDDILSLRKFIEEDANFLRPLQMQKRSQERGQRALEKSLRDSMFPNLKAGALAAGADMSSLIARITGDKEDAEGFIDLSGGVEQAGAAVAKDLMQPEWLSRGIRGATRSGVTMSATGIASGPYGAISAASALEGNRAITEGERAGLEGSELASYVGTKATWEALPAIVMQRMGLGGAEGYFGKGGIKAIEGGIKAGLKKVGTDVGLEVFEENLTEGGHLVSDVLWGTNPNALSPESLFATARDTTIQTVLMTGAMGSPKLAASALAKPSQGMAPLEPVSDDRRTLSAPEGSVAAEIAQQMEQETQGVRERIQRRAAQVPSLDPQDRLDQLQAIRTDKKQYVTVEEGRTLGFTDEQMKNRATRTKALDDLIQLTEQEIADEAERGVMEKPAENTGPDEPGSFEPEAQESEEASAAELEPPTSPQKPLEEIRGQGTTPALEATEDAVQATTEDDTRQNPDYSALSAKELSAEAKKRGLKGYLGKNREEMIKLLSEPGVSFTDEQGGTVKVTRPDKRQTTVHFGAEKEIEAIAAEKAEEAVQGIDTSTIKGEREAMQAVVDVAKANGLSPNELWRDVYAEPEGFARDIESALETPLPKTKGRPVDKPDLSKYSSESRVKEDYNQGRLTTGQAIDALGRIRGRKTAPPEAVERVELGIGGSSNFSKPTDRADIDPKPGSAKGAMLQGVQSPELFQLAKDLMSGDAPKVKRLRKAAGMFQGAEGFGPLAILIDPSTARDEQALSQTLAHEIGHLIDFLPDNTLKRGNLLGRLQTLRGFLSGTMPPLDKKDRDQIRRQARKEAGEGASKETVDSIRQRILKDRGLLANSVIRKELLDLTKWWSGDYTGGKKSYVKYRESSRELYAEALSVFLNSPGHLEERAPVFYKTLLDLLDTKPDVLAAYSTLQQMLNGTGSELAESRTQTLRDMFGRADEHIKALRTSQEQERRSVWSGVTEVLGQYFLTAGQPVFARLGRKPINRVEPAEAEAARFALDELFTINSPNHTFLRNIDDQVYQPLVSLMQERGLDRKAAEAEATFTLGEYLFHWRVANERDDVANPAGFTATPSQNQLNAIKARIGDAAYASLQQYAQRFHDRVFEVAEEAANEGVYNRDVFDETIKPNKDNYAAFRVTHHIDNPDYIATGVIQQVGTFSDVDNPFHATLLKVVRLNRLIELNRAKNRVRIFLEKNFAEDIRPVETVATGPGRSRIPKKRPGRGKEYLIELVNGKPTYFEVPTEIAKSFSMHDIGGLGRIAAVINSATYKVFHPLFVTYNPGFVLANPSRDLRRTWVNLGATDDISLGELLYEWAKSLPTAVRRQKGLEDDVIRDMIDSHAIDIPYTSIAAEGVDTQIDHLFQQYGFREKPKRLMEKVPVIGRALQFLENAGAVTETATKVAAWRLLDGKGHSVQERAFRVRKYAGTPDYKQRGLATGLTNAMLMYSRVRWNGLQADVNLATHPDTRVGWWWRQVVNVIVPTSLAKMGAYGAFGWAIRAMFGVADDDDESLPDKVATWTDETGKRIAKYFLTDYDVLPLGVNSDGKAVFLTIPRDDLGKFIARAWWHATDLVQLTAGQELREGESARDVIGNQVTEIKEEVIPSFSPPIEIASKWMQYGAGVNPLDSFYNQQIIPRKEWQAGGWESDSKMLAWTLDEFGSLGAVLHYPLSPLLGESFETGTSGGVEAVMQTAGAMTGLKRFLRVSDSGLTSDQWAMLENADQEAAAFRLSLPVDAQRATTRRYLLAKRESLGDELSDAEQTELHGLNLFYNAAYTPLRTMIQKAEESGEDTSKYREDMKRAAEDPMSLVGRSPDSVSADVARYLRGVVNAAVKPPPDTSDYRNRSRAYREATDIFQATREERQERLRFFLPDYDAAKRMLAEYYEYQKVSDDGRPLGSIYRKNSRNYKQGYRDRLRALKEMYGR